jgi:hypothetical protein
MHRENYQPVTSHQQRQNSYPYCIYDYSHSWLGTVTSIKSGRVNLVLLAQTIIEILLKVALNTNKSINYIQIT